jgi:hypothetical protein
LANPDTLRLFPSYGLTGNCSGPEVGFWEIRTSTELRICDESRAAAPPQTNSGLKLALMGWDSCPYVGLLESLPLRFIFLDHAVPDGDDTMRVLGDIVFMGHEDDRIAFRVQAIEQRHDLVAGL